MADTSKLRELAEQVSRLSEQPGWAHLLDVAQTYYTQHLSALRTDAPAFERGRCEGWVEAAEWLYGWPQSEAERLRLEMERLENEQENDDGE